MRTFTFLGLSNEEGTKGCVLVLRFKIPSIFDNVDFDSHPLRHLRKIMLKHRLVVNAATTIQADTFEEAEHLFIH
jgi:hypothetical protein